ncbi:MAG: tetratricopeptide repeat protein [Candidatus Obscuribacterales bacterium]
MSKQSRSIRILMALSLVTGGIALSGPAAAADPGKKESTKKDQIDIARLPDPCACGLDKKTFKLVNHGDWREAADRLEKLTVSDSGATRNRAWLAFCYMYLEDLTPLQELKKKIGDSQSAGGEEKSMALLIAAFEAITRGKPGEAEDLLKDLPRSQTNDAFVNFALAAVSAKNGKAGAAVEYCKRSIALDPGFAWGLRTCGYLELRWLNEPERAEESLLQALAIEPDQSEVREMLVTSLVGRERFDQAIDVAREGIRVNSRNADSYARLARIYLKQWRYREALVLLEKAIKLDQSRASFYRTVAGIKREQGDLEGAIASQNQAVALSKDKSFELVELAAMNDAAGHPDTAILNLHEAIKINAENNTAHMRLVSLLIKQKNWQDLVDEYRRVLKTRDKDARLHYHLGEALEAMDRTDDAMEEYLKAANLSEHDPRPLRKLGAIFVSRKEFEKAIKYYTRALNSGPVPAVKDLVALGYCNAQIESYLHAEAGFITALALQQFPGYKGDGDPRKEDIIRSLASLLLIEGRFNDAAAQFETLYSLTRDSESAVTDQYLLRQSRALSSRKSEDVKELLASFDKLPEKNQSGFRYALVQALLRLEKTEPASAQLARVTDEEIAKEPRWLVLKARASRLAGDRKEAASLLEKALAIATRTRDEKPAFLAEVELERARLAMDKKDPDAAETSAKAALEAYSRMYASYLVLARVSNERGKAREAIGFADKALEQNPYLTEAYIQTGDALMTLKEFNKAVDSYRKATDIYPASVEGHRKLLAAYKCLELADEIKKEEEQIARLEEIQ